MKKILALALALMMLLSLAACGGKTDPAPSGGDNTPSSQQTEQNTPDPGTDEPDNGGEEQVALEWPTADFIPESAKYNGTGTITLVGDEEEWEGARRIDVAINGSSLEDVGNYIASLKAAGYEYHDFDLDLDEPELAFAADYMFEWEGQNAEGRYLDITLHKEVKDTYWLDSNFQEHPYSYNLYIQLYDKCWLTD